MADARYVIDIIINARDDTAAAFASAIGNAEAMKRLQADQKRGNEELTRSYKDMTSELGTSQSTLKRTLDSVSRGSEDAAKKMVTLDETVKKHVRTVDEHGKKSAQAAVSLGELVQAENNLAKALKEAGDAQGDQTARTATETTKRIEQVKRERDFYLQAAKERAAADREAAAEREKAMREGEALARDIEETEATRHRSHIERLQQQAQQERETATLHEALRKQEFEARARELEEEGRLTRIRVANREEERKQFLEDARARLTAIENSNRDEIASDNEKFEAQKRQEAQAQRDFLEGARVRLTAIQNTERDEERAHEDRLKRQQRELTLPRQYIEQIQRVAALERQRDQARQEGRPVEAAKLDIDAGTAKAKAEATAAELRKILRHIEANVDLDDAEAVAHAAALRELLNTLLGHFEIKVDVDAGRAVAELAAVNAEARSTGNNLGILTGLIQAMSEGFNRSSGTIASFDNFLRGLMSLGIATFFNQLILLAGAAASALLGLASSAAVAGAALGGALVAGIAQAIPAVGLLVAAFSRIKAVFDAAKQAQLLQQQQSYQGEKQNKKAADTAMAVASAEERLADANRRVTEAQKNINDARQQGIDKLQELILAERGLTLGMDETQAAIRKAAASGTGSLDRLFLQRDETQQRLTTTRRDISQRESMGPGASPELAKAQEQLRDAQRAARDAERGLARAKSGADIAASGVTAASGKLDFLLGRLSDAERHLYRTVTRLQDVWRKFSQTATEPLITAFDSALQRITTLLQDPAIINAAKGLASGLASEFSSIFDHFSKGPALQQLLRIVDQSKDNLKPLGDIATNIGDAFLDIAEAAGPALTEILEWIRDITGDVAKFFDTGRKSGDLQKFFKDGVTQLKAWGDLLWAVIQLFAAIAGDKGGGGAKTGLKLVQDLAKAIRGWADAIKDPDSKLHEFFQRFFRIGRQMLDVFVPVFGALAKEFDKTFSKDGVKSVQGFATFLSDVLIPAVFDFARLLGNITGKIGEFARAHPGITKLASALLASALATTVFLRAGALFGPFISGFKFLIARIGLFEKLGSVLRGLFGVVTTATGVEAGPLAGIAGMAAPIAIVVAAIVGLLAISGKLDDVWRKIVDTAKRVWKEIQPGIDSIKKSFGDLVDEWQKGGGLVDVLKFIGRVIATVLIAGIDAFGDIFAGVFNGIAKILSGFVDILTGIMRLFRGDFSGAFDKFGEAFGKIFRGLGDIIWGEIKGIGGLFLDLGGDILDGLLKGLEGLVDALVGLFEDAWDAVLGFFGVASPSTIAADLGTAIIEGLWEGIKAAGRLLRDAADWIWDRIKNALRRDIAALQAIGRWIYNAAMDGLRSVANLLRNIGSWIWDRIKNTLRNDIRGLSVIGRWIWRAIKDAVNTVGDLLNQIGGWIWDRIKNTLRNDIRGLTTIGKWIWTSIKDSVSTLADSFKSIGKTVFNFIVEGFKSAPALLGEGLAWLIDHLPVPNLFNWKGKVKDALHLQEGGPVPGYGGGDRVSAMLEPGEHVWTKEEVSRAGGHDVLFALRAMFGGGSQSSGPGYQVGGAMQAAQNNPRGFWVAKNVQENRDDEDERRTHRQAEQETVRTTSERAKRWKEMWEQLKTITRQGANYVEEQIRDMRVNTSKTLDRMRDDIRHQLDLIVISFDNHGQKIADSWSATFDSLSATTYKGLNYIGHETNKALTALGEKHIDFHLAPPSKSEPERAPGAGHAGGGMVGHPGERGGDYVRTWLGRGEAVLNYAQQKYVEPAMQSFYGHGLTDTFKRVRGYHAGGPGQPGFAAGGMVEIDNTGRLAANKQLARVIASLMRRYHFAITAAGEQGHSANSDHHWGGAIDIVPGPGGSWAMLGQLAKAAGWRPNDPMPESGPFRWIGWNTEGGHGDPDHGAGTNAHLHLSWRRGGPFTGPGGAGADGAIEEIKRAIVDGIGPLKELAQAALDKVREAANKKIDESGGGDTASTVPLGPGGPPEKVFDYFVKRGLSDAIAAGFVGVFHKESGFNTTVANSKSGATGLAQWLGGRLAALKSKADWDSLQTQLDFVWEELMGPESAAYRAILQAKTPEEAARIIDSAYERSDGLLDAPQFARQAFQKFGSSDDHGPRKATGGVVGPEGGEFAVGGEVPGGQGIPVPIIAHAGEWVLNRRQQAQVAGWLGVAHGSLRERLGFGGGAKGHFQDGGEVIPSLATRQKQARKGVYDPNDLLADPTDLTGIIREIGLVNTAIKNLSTKGKIGKQIDNFLKLLGNLTNDGGRLDQMTAIIEKLSTDLQRNIDLAQVGFKRVGSKLISSSQIFGGKFRRWGQQQSNVLTDAVEIADQTIDMYATLYQGLRNQRTTTEKELDDVNAKIKEVEKGGVKGKAEEDRYTKLVQSRSKLRNTLDSTDDKILDNRQKIYEAQVDRFNKETEKQLQFSTRKGTVAEMGSRIAQIFGREGGTAAFGQQQLAALQEQQKIVQQRLSAAQQKARKDPRWQSVVDDLQKQVDDLSVSVAEQIHNNLQAQVEAINTDIQRRQAGLDIARRVAAVTGGDLPSLTQQGANLMLEQIQRLSAKIPELAAAGDEGLVRQTQEQIADLQASIVEANAQVVTEIIDDINKAAERREVFINFRRRLAQAFGNTGALAGLAQESINSLQTQLNDMQRALNEAAYRGNWEQVAEIQQQMEDLRTTIAESTAQMLREAGEEIDRQATRREAALAIRGRVADLQERAGDRLGAIRARQGVSGGRIQSLQTTQVATQQLLATVLAAQPENVGLINDLTDKLADLNQTINEEIQAQKDLTFTYRNVATQIITERTGTITGLIGTASQIIQKVGQLVGAVNLPLLQQLLVQTGDTLRRTATDLAENVRAAIGEFGGEGGNILTQLVDAFQRGPVEFATALARLGPAIALLEEGMSAEQKTAFQALIDSMINNTTALLDNTDQLGQLTGSNTQTFSSSLWTLLRSAIFTGSGQILPQFQFAFPQMQNGGFVHRTGLYNLHAGETVVPAGSNGDGAFQQNLYITNPTEVADPNYIFSVAEFNRSNRRAT